MKDRLNVFTKKEAIASVNIDKDRITMTEDREPTASITLLYENIYTKSDTDVYEIITTRNWLTKFEKQFINKDDPIALKQAGLVRIDDLKHFIKDKMYVLDPRYSNKPIVNSEDLFKFIELLGDKE